MSSTTENWALNQNRQQTLTHIFPLIRIKTYWLTFFIFFRKLDLFLRYLYVSFQSLTTHRTNLRLGMFLSMCICLNFGTKSCLSLIDPILNSFAIQPVRLPDQIALAIRNNGEHWYTF